MSRWKMLMGSAVLWLTACGAGTPAVLETDQTTYAPGAKVMLRLGNRSLQPLGYNLCFTALQRLDGQDWVVVPRPETEPREVCPLPGDAESRVDFLVVPPPRRVAAGGRVPLPHERGVAVG